MSRMPLRDFVPPVVVRLAQGRRLGREYPSYEAALATYAAGYNAVEIADVVVAKTIERKASVGASTVDQVAIQPLVALGISGGLRVLDFGGGAGHHYLLASHVRTGLDWRVVETPSMAHSAKAMESAELRFFERIDDAVSDWTPDLTFASGVLQYVPDPLATLAELIAIRAPVLFITRTAVSEDRRRVYVQRSRLSENGPGPLPIGVADREVRYPITLVPRAELESAISGIYEVRLRIVEQDGKVGYVCRLRGSGGVGVNGS